MKLSIAGPVLVTGGSGFVGRTVVSALASAGAAVRVLSRHPLPAEPGALAVHFPGDLLDERVLGRALAGAAAVVHLAAATSGTAASLFRTNVDGTRALARAALRASVPRFVHVSSAGVYGDGATDSPNPETAETVPHNDYGRSKLEAERALVAELAGSKAAWNILRPYGVYGPRRLDFFHEVKRRRLWLYGPTEVVLHPTHVDDVASAVIAALENAERDGVRGETFNVAGERPIRHFDFVALVARALGVRAVRVATPAPLNAALGRLVSAWPGAPDAVVRRARPRVVYAANIEKARRVLGWAPMPLARGVEETIRTARRAGAL